jgi:CMP-N,N'-diacetyllegionaminic acid synthase
VTRAVAIIPARGGSKRVPGKNLVPIAGRPLVVHTIEHALAARLVDEVWVSTDDDEIAAVAERAGAQVVRRPADIAGDDASSEAALLHALDARDAPDPDLVVFLQATSPVRAPGDVDAAIELLLAREADSLFSAHREAAFTWREVDGALTSDYDHRERPRSQDMRPRWRENGSIYVVRPTILRAERNRLGGRVVVYEMGFWASFDLDDEHDAALLDWILTAKVPPDVR